MTKFDNFVSETTWIKPYTKIPIWYQEKTDYILCCFDINNNYDIFKNDKRLTKEFVVGSLNFYPKSKFKYTSKNWALPMLVSDYFAHKSDFKNELIWAKKAIKHNSNLTSLQFSFQIRDRLSPKNDTNK
jgi:hypothetical protein